MAGKNIRPVQISEYGRRMGESHGRAKLSDRDVELIFELRYGGMRVVEIAEKMEIHKRYVYKLLNGERRACAPRRHT